MKPRSEVSAQSVVEPHGRRSADVQPAADAAAGFLLGLLIFCLLCFALGAWALVRRGRRQAAVTLAGTQAVVTAPPADTAPPSPWERDADWWKKKS